MNRTITTEETEKLFEFCRKHYVAHYDLQIELVDHLASSIEQQWNENPNISVDAALMNTYKKFGISGFGKIKAQKQKELTRKYNRIIWKYLIEFFSWPKIMMTTAFTLALATIFRVVENDKWVLAVIFSGTTLFILVQYLFIIPKKFKKTQRQGKKFLLLEQVGNGQTICFAILQLMVQSPNLCKFIKFDILQNTVGIFGVSLVIVILCILLFGEMFFIPRKVKEHFSEQFPEFAL